MFPLVSSCVQAISMQVYRFAVVVTKAVIPKDLWGGDENFRLAMSGKPYFRCLERSHCPLQL